MITVANPIYDAVFKYLMEDVRIAKHRLLSAASDAKVRQDMNVEEEYFQAIENRDTAIMMRDQRIEEQNNQIAEQSNQIAEQNNQIAEQNNQIAEQSNQIAEQEKALYVSAKALKQAGLSPTQISELTKLPIETIAEL